MNEENGRLQDRLKQIESQVCLSIDVRLKTVCLKL